MKIRLNVDTISNDMLFNQLSNIAKNGHWARTFESMMMSLLFNIEIITLQIKKHTTNYSLSIHSIKQFWKDYKQPCRKLHKIFIYYHEYLSPLPSLDSIHNHYLHLEQLQPSSLSTFIIHEMIATNQLQPIQPKPTLLQPTLLLSTLPQSKQHMPMKLLPSAKKKQTVKAARKLKSYPTSFWFSTCDKFNNGSYKTIC